MTVYGNDFWEIIKPLETANLILNPSFETDTTGWAGWAGGTISRTTASQFFGVYGLEVTPTSLLFDGAYYGADSIPFALTASQTYTMSIYFKGQAGIPYRMFFANASGTQEGGSATWTATGDWERQSLSYTPSSTASRQAYIQKNNNADTGVFIIDGLQVEAQSEASTYCDGDQEGCIWLANPHGSISWRNGKSKAGGQIIDLNSDYDIIVRQQPGAGMPPVENIQTSLGLQDGGLFQRTRTQVRPLTLDGTITGSDVNDFHYNRQQFIDLFKPDQGVPQGPFLLRYNSSSAVTKQLRVHYDSGFEMTRIDNKTEFFSMRLIAYDPYWEEIKDTAYSPSVIFSTGNTDTMFRQPDNSAGSDGRWYAISLNQTVSIKGTDNKIYMGGFHTTPGYRVSRYNFQLKTSETIGLPTGTACGINDEVHALAFDSQGNLFIGGIFTTAGSLSASRIVKWDGNDFVQVGGGDGFDDDVKTLVVDKNDNLYIGGQFTSSGSNTINAIAKWTPESAEFTQVGDGVSLTSGCLEVSSIALEPSGSGLYISGCFDSSGSIGACGFAYFNGVEFANLGSACINGHVKRLAIKPDNTVFLGGVFSGTFPDSAGSPANLAYWDGVQYSISSENSPNGSVNDISYDDQTGLLAVAGNSLNTASPLDVGGNYMFWNGATWIYSSVITPCNISNIYYGNGIEMLSFTSLQPRQLAPREEVFNPGTAEANPDLTFSLPLSTSTASTNVFFFENFSASKIVGIEYTIRGGETITLSTANGTAISDLRGNIVGDILPGGNFSTWKLLPGNNTVFAFANSASVSAFIKWKNRHWSIDGGHS